MMAFCGVWKQSFSTPTVETLMIQTNLLQPHKTLYPVVKYHVIKRSESQFKSDSSCVLRVTPLFIIGSQIVALKDKSGHIPQFSQKSTNPMKRTKNRQWIDSSNKYCLLSLMSLRPPLLSKNTHTSLVRTNGLKAEGQRQRGEFLWHLLTVKHIQNDTRV